MRWRVAVALVALGAAVVPALSVAARRGRAASGGVKVTPAGGSGTTRFVVSFRAPDAAGPYGGSERRYSVTASAPQGRGCDSSGAGSVGSARQGQLVHVKLAPGDHWCRGTYQGSVDELMTPLCLPVRVCPQYVAVVRRVGRFTFKVR